MTSKFSLEAEAHIRDCFKALKFDKERHLYRVPKDGRMIYLPSVSSLVESHAPKFNLEGILPYSAAKENVPVEYLRDKWRRINEDACKLGTTTHEFLESYTGFQTPSTPQERAGVDFIKNILTTHRISFRELRVYSREFMYAGTMDLPLEPIEGNWFDIADYKTNGDLFKAYDMLKPPFNMMESSPYNKYQIQLSYYQIPLEEVGLTIKRRLLVHLTEDAKYRVYELEDLTEYLRDYMRFKKKKAA